MVLGARCSEVGGSVTPPGTITIPAPHYQAQCEAPALSLYQGEADKAALSSYHRHPPCPQQEAWQGLVYTEHVT